MSWNRMRYAAMVMLLVCAGCARTAKITAPSASLPGQPFGAVTHVTYHTVVRGETLWRIARMYGMDVDDLAELNRIQDAAKLEAGQQIAVPAGRQKQLPSAQAAAEDFIWPLKGTVIARFNQSSDKFTNKGLNIKPARSPEVIASSGGRVVFCHDDFLDLGKTVILEHAGGFWTVYGRNSEVYVKPGDQVQRGAVIASAGSAGRDPAVYLHFEIRKGSLPQNPAFYLP